MTDFTLEELLEINQALTHFYLNMEDHLVNSDLAFKVIRAIELKAIKKPSESRENLDVIKGVINGEIPISVRMSCQHAFKLPCEKCGKMVAIGTRAK